MGPRPPTTTVPDDSELAGDVGSAIEMPPFSCTAQMLGDPMLFVVLVVATAAPAAATIDVEDEGAPLDPVPAAAPLFAVLVAAVLAALAVAAAMGLVIFM